MCLPNWYRSRLVHGKERVDIPKLHENEAGCDPRCASDGHGCYLEGFQLSLLKEEHRILVRICPLDSDAPGPLWIHGHPNHRQVDD